MPKVCMLTIDHSPRDNRIFFKESQSLKNAGYEVTILCSADAQGFVRDMGRKKILNPNKVAEFEMEGVKVIAIRRPKGVIEKYSSKIFKGKFFGRMIARGIELNADVYHAHEPAAYYIGLKIQKRIETKLIFDQHESWKKGTFKERYIKKYYLKDLKYFISANEITRGNVLHLNQKINAEVIYNYVHPGYYVPSFNEKKLDDPIIVHEGILPFNRGLKDIIEMMRLLKKNWPRVKLRIVGEVFGEEKAYLKSKKEEYGLEESIEETGWLDYEDVGDHLKDCSIGLITKDYTDNNILGGPALKIFSYFAYGIAVVDVNLPESTRFLDSTDAGVSVKVRTVENLYLVIERLLKDRDLLKRYCLNSYKAHETHVWKSEEKKLLNFYKNVVLNKDAIHFR
ncbi:MAG: glycosyltransferase [Bacteroidetes bacterium]|nr:glycosyltransferase [Bacteroidota bacterium]